MARKNHNRYRVNLVPKRYQPPRKCKKPKPFPFYSLPGELRFAVYNHCLVVPISDTAVRLPFVESCPQVKQALARFTAMSKVSKQMRDEVWEYFLQQNKFHWHGKFTNSLWKSFQNYALPYVRVLSLSIADYQLCWLNEAKIRKILVWMSIHSDPDFTDRYIWNLRQLRLVVRNCYRDLERDDQVWYNYGSIDKFNTACGGNTGPFPTITGLQELRLEIPWTMKRDSEWKDRLCSEVGGDRGQCEVVFAKNTSVLGVIRPRKGPWEAR
ncbi:hypothetical protein diail_8751 [Diaporthe ilicicola]|nr:hypothetical protein diail_8751 [Diaporthe ilicicola]